MLRKITVSWVLVVAILGTGTALASGSDPTIEQIYQATQAGRMAQAEQMVAQVLQDHPGSGKAHYVAAEVYARAGDFATARRELGTAESLEPGLPFARPQSVQALQAELSQGRFVPRVQRVPYAPYAPYVRPHSSFPWSVILVIGAGIVIVWALMRRRSQPVYPQYPGQPGMPPNVGPMGMGGGGVMPPYPYGYGGGTGSGIMGSIGTGLAVGAGVAAGEALVNHIVSGSQSGGIVPPAGADELAEPPVNGDMGGSDFGVSDGSSWDAGSGGGDLGGGGDFGAGGGDDGGGWT
jgi:hypothetical protein